MNNAVKPNIVADRILELYGTPDQKARYQDKVLPMEEFMESCVRPLLRTEIQGYKTLRRFKPEAYETTIDKFKVIEVPHSESSLTAEQYASLKQLRTICSHDVVINGLKADLTCTLVEKHIYVEGERVDVFPLALIELIISDPQKRAQPVVTRRRVEL
jgi:hypothetical protein